jgi:hypothetical protein
VGQAPPPPRATPRAGRRARAGATPPPLVSGLGLMVPMDFRYPSPEAVGNASGRTTLAEIAVRRDGGTCMSQQGSAIQASPTKELFISMLVRDIELTPAIVDLVDNSFDGAIRLRGHPGHSMGSGSGFKSLRSDSGSPTTAAGFLWRSLDLTPSDSAGPPKRR